MFWTLTNDSIYQTTLAMPKLKYYMNMYIYTCSKTTDDKLMNQYLEQNKHQSLTAACKNLVSGLKITKASEHEIIVLTQTRQDDMLARLITFGNSSVNGTDLLTRAIKWAGGMTYGS